MRSWSTKSKDQITWCKHSSKSFRWCNNSTTSSSSCCISPNTFSRLRASSNMQGAMLLSHQVLGLTLLPMLHQPTTTIKSTILNRVSSLSRVLLDCKRVSMLSRVPPFSSLQLSSSLARRLRTPSSRFTKSSPSHSSHSSPLSSSSSSKCKLVSSIKASNPKFSSRSRQSSSKLHRST